MVGKVPWCRKVGSLVVWKVANGSGERDFGVLGVPNGSGYSFQYKYRVKREMKRR